LFTPLLAAVLDMVVPEALISAFCRTVTPPTGRMLGYLDQAARRIRPDRASQISIRIRVSGILLDLPWRPAYSRKTAKCWRGIP